MTATPSELNVFGLLFDNNNEHNGKSPLLEMIKLESDELGQTINNYLICTTNVEVRNESHRMIYRRAGIPETLPFSLTIDRIDQKDEKWRGTSWRGAGYIAIKRALTNLTSPPCVVIFDLDTKGQPTKVDSGKEAFETKILDLLNVCKNGQFAEILEKRGFQDQPKIDLIYSANQEISDDCERYILSLEGDHNFKRKVINTLSDLENKPLGTIPCKNQSSSNPTSSNQFIQNNIQKKRPLNPKIFTVIATLLLSSAFAYFISFFSSKNNDPTESLTLKDPNAIIDQATDKIALPDDNHTEFTPGFKFVRALVKRKNANNEYDEDLIQVNDGIYFPDDQLVFEFNPLSDGYIYQILLDKNEDEWAILNSAGTSNNIYAVKNGTTYQIPGDDSAYQITDCPSISYLVLIHSAQTLPNLEALYGDPKKSIPVESANKFHAVINDVSEAQVFKHEIKIDPSQTKQHIHCMSSEQQNNIHEKHHKLNSISDLLNLWQQQHKPELLRLLRTRMKTLPDDIANNLNHHDRTLLHNANDLLTVLSHAENILQQDASDPLELMMINNFNDTQESEVYDISNGVLSRIRSSSKSADLKLINKFTILNTSKIKQNGVDLIGVKITVESNLSWDLFHYNLKTFTIDAIGTESNEQAALDVTLRHAKQKIIHQIEKLLVDDYLQIHMKKFFYQQ